MSDASPPSILFDLTAGWYLDRRSCTMQEMTAIFEVGRQLVSLLAEQAKDHQGDQVELDRIVRQIRLSWERPGGNPDARLDLKCEIRFTSGRSVGSRIEGVKTTSTTDEFHGVARAILDRARREHMLQRDTFEQELAAISAPAFELLQPPA